MSIVVRSKRFRLSSFSGYFSEWASSLPGEEREKLAKERAVERILDQFATVTSSFVLEHVNAVYLLPVKGSDSKGLTRSDAVGAKASSGVEANRVSDKDCSVPKSELDESDIYNPRAKTRLAKKRNLVVYVDNSLVAAELDAQRELLRLRYLEEHLIELVDFEVRLSKGKYRKVHPYLERQGGAALGRSTSSMAVSRETLPIAERERIDELTGSIEDGRLRRAFEQAMAATFVKNRKNSEE